MDSQYEEMRNICATLEVILSINTTLDDSDAIKKLIRTYPGDLSDNLVKEI
jgi:hypothetical protein